MSNKKDFALGIVVTPPDPVLSGTSLTMRVGDGVRMPAVPFYATAAPSDQITSLDTAEKILVTDTTDDTITFTREQGDTTAKPITAGWFIANAIYADDIAELATNADLALKENLLPTTPSNPDNKFLNGNKQWAEVTVGNGGYAARLYFTTQNSVVSGYKQISYTNETAETELPATITAGEYLLRTYLFDADISTTSIDAGPWIVSYRAKVSNKVGTTNLNIEPFLRHADGSETTLFKAIGDNINSTDYVTIYKESEQPSFTCVATDRLGLRIYGQTTHSASLTINTIVGGSNAAYMNIPIKLRHNQLRDLNGDPNYQHITSAEKTAITHSNRAALDLVSGTNTGDQVISDATISLTDITTNNVSTSKHGFTPKAPNDTNKYLAGDGTWTTLPSLGAITYDELLTGTVNGTNTVFTTAANFTDIQVYKNGVAMHITDDFTVTGANQITMVTAPATGTKLTATYVNSSSTMIQGSNSLISDEVPSGLVNSSNKSYTCSQAYIANSLEVFINGVKQARGTHFTETTPTSGVFTMSDAPTTGDNIIVNYQFVSSVSGNADTLDGFHANSTPTANNILPLDSNAKVPVSAMYTSGSGTYSSHSATDVSTTSTTFVDVSGVSCDITTTGKKLMIQASAVMSQSANTGFMGVRVNGVDYNMAQNTSSTSIEQGRIIPVTGLAAGTYTIQMRIRTDSGGTCTLKQYFLKNITAWEV